MEIHGKDGAMFVRAELLSEKGHVLMGKFEWQIRGCLCPTCVLLATLM